MSNILWAVLAVNGALVVVNSMLTLWNWRLLRLNQALATMRRPAPVR